MVKVKDFDTVRNLINEVEKTDSALERKDITIAGIYQQNCVFQEYEPPAPNPLGLAKDKANTAIRIALKQYRSDIIGILKSYGVDKEDSDGN